ncbi:MAG: hypothetical protein FWC79_05880 [Oscillospiraceae bacterium]|nr:hypothetical protein [Oscillospiraceae bacterium]
MENASKALIIAGAVLLAILLIAIGMLIFQGATGQVDQSLQAMSAQEVQAFNRPWEGYMTRPQTRSQILALINAINVHNANNDMTIELRAATLVTGGGDANYAAAAPLTTAHRYTVLAGHGDIGQINAIYISAGDLGATPGGAGSD